MLPQLAELAATVEAAGRDVFLAFLRIGGLMLLLPGLGERMIPVRVRLALALALAAAVGLSQPLPADAPPLPLLIVRETAIGAALGAAVRMAAQALTLAGAIAAQATSLSHLFGGQATEAASIYGQTLQLAGLALLMAAGLPLWVIDMVIRSYDVLPVTGWPPGRDLALWGIGRMGHAFALAFVLAAPFVLASMLYNVAMGVLNRAMPQLMVALVGAPLITGLGLAILALSAPLILDVWARAMEAVLADPVALP
jgi:flagellar biosynthetic protein FliR